MAPYAAFSKTPILLCEGSSLAYGTEQVLRSSAIKRVIILGNGASVSDELEQQLVSFVPERTVLRLAGSNRYETSLKIAEWCIASGGMRADHAALTTGENFPDALVGATLLGRRGAVLLLVSDTDSSSLEVLSKYRATMTKLHFFGDGNSVSLELQRLALMVLGWERVF
jgi:putative cell wall-binding protein